MSAMSTGDPDSREKTSSSGTEAISNTTAPEQHTEADGECDEAPDGGYGWVLVVAIVFMTATTWGFNSSFGVYLAHFEDNSTFPGATPLKYSFVGALSVAVALLCAPLANLLTKRFGHRLPMLIGMVACSLGQCMAGLCRSFGAYIACQGLIFGIGLGMTLIPSQPLLAHWFKRRLSLAQGIANGGSGLGGLIFANTTRLLIDKLSVKYSLIINGSISAGVVLPCILLMKPRLQISGARSEPLQVSWLVHRGFIWVWLWGWFAMMSFYITLFSIAVYATDGLGLSQTQGAIVQSLLAAGVMVGRPLSGFILDTFGRVNMAIILSLLNGVACWAIWLPSRGFAAISVFAIVQGCAGGAVWSAAAPVAASVVGVKHLGSAMSIFWLTLVIPSFAGNPLAVLLQQYSRDNLGRSGPDAYAISIGFCGGLSAAAGLCLYGAKWFLQGSPKLFLKT